MQENNWTFSMGLLQFFIFPLLLFCALGSTQEQKLIVSESMLEDDFSSQAAQHGIEYKKADDETKYLVSPEKHHIKMRRRLMKKNKGSKGLIAIQLPTTTMESTSEILVTTTDGQAAQREIKYMKADDAEKKKVLTKQTRGSQRRSHRQKKKTKPSAPMTTTTPELIDVMKTTTDEMIRRLRGKKKDSRGLFDIFKKKKLPTTTMESTTTTILVTTINEELQEKMKNLNQAAIISISAVSAVIILGILNCILWHRKKIKLPSLPFMKKPNPNNTTEV